MKKLMGALFALTLVCGFATSWFAGYCYGQEESSEEQKLRDLLFGEIPVIVTASKREQLATDSPVAIEIITAEEIEQSGATTIPDLLRMVSGADVMAISSLDQYVSVHGFNGPLGSSPLLVMIDGRPMEWGIHNLVSWNDQQIGLDEIQRIEIVKGPGSSLYGANAFGGMINIITKKPQEINATEMHITAGVPNLFIGSLLHARVGYKVDYKVSAEWDGRDEITDDKDSAGSVTKGNAFVEYHKEEDRKVSISAGRGDIRGQKMFIGIGNGTGKKSGFNDYVQLESQYDKFKFKAFYKSQDYVFDYITSMDEDFNVENIDAEMQHTIDAGSINSIIWGMNYRNNKVSKGFGFSDLHIQDLWGVFIEDQIKIDDKLNFFLGGRFDEHPLTEDRFSPRASALYYFTKEHIMRVSWSEAFRNPTLVNSYIYNSAVVIDPLYGPVTSLTVGNKNLKPESITHADIEYRLRIAKKMYGNVLLYRSEYKDFINWSVTTDITKPQTTYSFENTGKAESIGGDISFNMLLTEWLTGMVNYSYLKVTRDGSSERVKDYPENKFNIGCDMKFDNGVSVFMLANWVDKIQVDDYIDLLGNIYSVSLDPRIVFNTSIGYDINKQARVSLSVFNLLDRRYYELHPGNDLQNPISEEFGRRVTTKLSYKF
ncbi:MAG: TonB-dependent receptor [Endomicrobiales bacterium]|nr:TonB-dependent receptor [Endomicrobiales bacterium]